MFIDMNLAEDKHHGQLSLCAETRLGDLFESKNWGIGAIWDLVIQ